MAAFNEEARARRELENTSNPLLKLPAELRNRIYILALEPDFPSDIYISSYRLSEGPSAPSILQTSRQLRKETTPIWYGGRECIFLISATGSDCVKWLNALPTEAIQSLRYLRFMLHVQSSHEHASTTGSFWHSHIEISACGKDEGLRYSYCCTETRYDGSERKVLDADCEEARNVGTNARRILKHMRDRVASFDDDEQVLRRCDLLDLVRALQVSWVH